MSASILKQLSQLDALWEALRTRELNRILFAALVGFPLAVKATRRGRRRARGRAKAMRRAIR
jgi:hypothetical protein